MLYVTAEFYHHFDYMLYIVCSVQAALTPEEEYILVKNHTYLLTNLPADELKDRLYQELVITQLQLEEIELPMNTHRVKNEKILKFLKRHRDGYKVLMAFLEHPDHISTGIADQLRATDTSQVQVKR